MRHRRQALLFRTPFTFSRALASNLALFLGAPWSRVAKQVKADSGPSKEVFLLDGNAGVIMIDGSEGWIGFDYTVIQ